jgi:hypothetical protein
VAGIDELWLQTDELEEFISALEFSAEILPATAENTLKWKWVIIALHNAVQGVCVCALRGADTSGISVLDKETGAAAWHWLDVESRKPNPGPSPREKLASTMELYKRVKRARYLEHPLLKNTARDKDILQLNSLRNQFIHFVPQGWSIELSGMPRIVGSVCDCIKHLAINFPTFWHHFRTGDPERISSAVATLEEFSNRN